MVVLNDVVVSALGSIPALLVNSFSYRDEERKQCFPYSPAFYFSLETKECNSTVECALDMGDTLVQL